MSSRPRISSTAALVVLLAATAVSGAVALRPGSLQASARSAATEKPADAWLKGLTGKHRQLFDAPAPAGGLPLIHMMNYYDTYNRAYGVKDADIDAVGTFYGGTTFYGVNDAMWTKYRIGEFLEVNDAEKKPATANPWRSNPEILGMRLPQASIESLQKRGATFILCDNALTYFAGQLAQARDLDAKTVYADLKANILPGVELVPGMVVAITQAQEAGVSYIRQ